MRFVRWSLTIAPDAEERTYAAGCTTCDETPDESMERGALELWCLRHAGRTGHRSFRMTATSLLLATQLEGPVPH
ncbi:DUF7848 domain-containing protein [Streptomyces zingiberis]|uniref:DUF7848 domain-containing protein n=1 Tax=Streptomyces zingiberis TaxID=2053010 RepID=A0ABX1BZ10_9ACTN|nr:hypothetical protein [Streptomyces zingiberis]NJQ00564.1 hypothetical protein [Streptomyces zingiberis]